MTKYKSRFAQTVLMVLIMFMITAVVSGCANSTDKNQDGTPQVGTKVGDIAPDFSIEMLTGETITLSDYRGQVVFLNFWASWCGPCVQEFPALQQLSEAFPEEMTLLAIDIRETEDKVQAFLDDNGITFAVGIDETGDVSGLYPTESIPLSVVINADGIITYIRAGANNNMFPIYQSEVQNALGE